MDSVNCIQTFVSSEWRCDFFFIGWLSVVHCSYKCISGTVTCRMFGTMLNLSTSGNANIPSYNIAPICTVKNWRGRYGILYQMCDIEGRCSVESINSAHGNLEISNSLREHGY